MSDHPIEKKIIKKYDSIIGMKAFRFFTESEIRYVMDKKRGFNEVLDTCIKPGLKKFLNDEIEKVLLI